MRVQELTEDRMDELLREYFRRGGRLEVARSFKQDSGAECDLDLENFVMS